MKQGKGSKENDQLEKYNHFLYSALKPNWIKKRNRTFSYA